jgi:hypothetical protein
MDLGRRHGAFLAVDPQEQPFRRDSGQLRLLLSATLPLHGCVVRSDTRRADDAAN